MSVEGMWAIYFGDVDQQQVNSGVLVLETERIFGGDSLMAYKGTYGVANGTIEASALIWAYNPTIDVVSAFGEVSPSPSTVSLQGQIGSDNNGSPMISAQIWQEQNPTVKLPARLVKISDLP